jgi:hypothetical protein
MTYNMAFRGRAVLVVEGVEHEVFADLHQYEDSGGLRSWYGSLSSEAVDWFPLMGADGLRLRLPNGREGVVLVTGHAVPSRVVTVRGTAQHPSFLPSPTPHRSRGVRRSSQALIHSSARRAAASQELFLEREEQT